MSIFWSTLLKMKDVYMFVVAKTSVIYAIVFLVCVSDATAAENTVSQLTRSDPMSSSYILQLILGLFVVVLCIVALAWFAKKMNRFQSMSDSSLKVITAISLGSRDRAVLIQVGEEQVLVGVSPGRIIPLHTLDTPVEIAADALTGTAGKSFSDKLKAMMADANKSSNMKQDK